MLENIERSLDLGTYMDPAGKTCKVFCIAEDDDTGERKVVYIRSHHGNKSGHALMKGVGAFLDELKSGKFRYHGPHPRMFGTNLPSPSVLIARKGGVQDGKAN